MNVNDIRLENDIYVYIGSRFEVFKECINRIFGTKNIEFYGTEYDIPKYFCNRRIYGGGRVDMMYGNKDMYVPIELKYEANSEGYYQLKKYIKLLEDKTQKEINGVLVCKHATKSLKEIQLENNIAVIELETGKVW